MIRTLTVFVVMLFLVACGATARAPDVPYPAFVDTNELFGVFLVELPGVEGVQFSIDMRSRDSSNRVDFPAGWRGTTGGAPGKNIEIYVLQGRLRLSEFVLEPGGYAYLPAGSLGFRLETESGARVLYSLRQPDPRAHIRSPLILENPRLDWHEAIDGVSVALLRVDSGNGSRTFLRRIQPGTSLPWEMSSAMREGYLLSGEYTDSECVAGIPVTNTYRPDGYFRRPAGAVSGGPDAVAVNESIWFFREGSDASINYPDDCVAPAQGPSD